MNDTCAPRVTLLGFTVPDDVFARITARDTVLATQTQTFAWAVARSLRAGGCPVQLVSAAPVSTYPRNRQVVFRGGRFRQDGIDGRLLGFVNLLGAKHLTRFAAACRSASRGLREHRSDVLMVHGVHSPFLWFGALAARRSDLRVVVVLTDPPGVAQPTDGRLLRLLRGIDVALVRAALRRCTGVVALTSALAEDFAPGKPRLVMEGIFAPPPVDRSAPPRPAVREVAYAGGLTRAYGVDRLVEAFRGLPDPDLRLCLYGRGELTDWLRAQAEADPRIRPPAVLDRAELVGRLATAAVLVNPRPVDQGFVRYSFPSKLIEYLAAGVPVVTTRLPGIPPEYAPWLRFAEPDTADGLRESIAAVLSLPAAAARALGAGGAAFVRNGRSPEAQGERLRSFLAGLTAGATGRPAMAGGPTVAVGHRAARADDRDGGVRADA
ncbi:glycosyltransferase [Micromonospora sp. NPDC048930]|uniref:glycosyltransferase n=1 Tax=Micromonospora sp. NPDC048930 TaxID=3364261 RepID=UPI0037217F75